MSREDLESNQPEPNTNESLEISVAEREAAETLQTEKDLSPEEVEHLVSLVTDPNLSMEVLGYNFGHDRKQKLTPEQMEKLFSQALINEDVVRIFYTTLTQFGGEISECERLWLERLEEVISGYDI